MLKVICNLLQEKLFGTLWGFFSLSNSQSPLELKVETKGPHDNSENIVFAKTENRYYILALRSHVNSVFGAWKCIFLKMGSGVETFEMQPLLLRL